MINIFDKYLFRRYLSVFLIVFFSTFGLYTVIDGFTNADAFQEGQEGAVSLVLTMFSYYGYQSSLFFDMTGSIISVVSIMVVFALLFRHSEIQPMLAAGVPIYRLVLPVICAALIVNASIIANQELVIPRIAHQLQSSRSEVRGDRQNVEQVNDYETGILIGGKALYVKTRQLEEARFVLPVPEIADSLTPLRAKQARFRNATNELPAGWLLEEVTPKFASLKPNLTALGQKTVLAVEEPNSVFVVSNVSFDQLSKNSRGYRYVSTPELIRRIKNPAYSVVSIRGQMLNLHSRLTRPLLDMIAVLIAVPLILRKESRGLVGNMAMCASVLGFAYGFGQGAQYLGSINIISTDLATWIPIILSGTLAAWLSGIVQT